MLAHSYFAPNGANSIDKTPGAINISSLTGRTLETVRPGKLQSRSIELNL